MLRIVDARLGEIVLPTGRKARLQLLEQHPAVMHLLDDLESLGDDPIALTVGIEPVDRSCISPCKPEILVKPSKLLTTSRISGVVLSPAVRARPICCL